MNLKQTLSDLIAINSVSAITNAPIIDPLEGICGALGFNTRRFSYLDDNGVDKINLVAIIGTEWSEVTEVELALVIGKPASLVTRDRALEYVAGYCIGLDITIRGPEERSLRKSPDSYSVLGPWLVTADEIPDSGDLGLRLSVNGEIRQESSTADLILGVPELIEYASSFYTLFPGDVILTGTPAGVSPIQPGDTITASIDKIGTMHVHVHAG